MKVNYLEWDSVFFNLKIGEINQLLPENVDNYKSYDLIYLKRNSLAVCLPKLVNFKKTIQQHKVYFTKQNIELNNVNLINIKVLDKANQHQFALYDLAFESGKYSRFKIDTNFKSNDFTSLYKQWIDNSFKHEFADEILVYELEGELLGFVTYKINKKSAKIGLIATSPNSQGKGIGTMLIEAVENQLVLKNVFELTIPTQKENAPACKFYTKLGYKITKEEIITHYWNNDTIQQTTPNR